MKPIKFEPYTWYFSAINRSYTLKTGNYSCSLLLEMADTSLALLSSAAEARALSAKINEWADAKEESERVTFGDLSIGDVFRTPTYESAWMTISLGGPGALRGHAVCVVAGETYHVGDRELFLDSCAVVRLRATFEEVKP